MIGYKIRYADYGCDCCGKTEFAEYIDYDQVVYINYNKAVEIMKDANEQFPDKNFSIYEVKIQ